MGEATRNEFSWHNQAIRKQKLKSGTGLDYSLYFRNSSWGENIIVASSQGRVEITRSA
jgi:hypothetical protein